MVRDDSSIVAHGCVWPVVLRTDTGLASAFHLIDWAARKDSPGAGVKVLLQCCANRAGVLVVGGSPATRKILPAIGFKKHNTVSLLQRPLRAVQPALSQSPRDIKLPARVLRNLFRHFWPKTALPDGWSFVPVKPVGIPPELLPGNVAGTAVSVRSPELLDHVMSCPAVSRSSCHLLMRGGTAVGYFVLLQIRKEVRLADYGPAGLDAETARALGSAAQAAARLFSDCDLLSAETTEDAVRDGFFASGFRLAGEEPINFLRRDKSLPPIERFRLTMIDSDAAVL